MQNIHVKRFNDNVRGVIEPDDRSWLLVVDADDTAVFYRRTEAKIVRGKACHRYTDAELPTRGGICAEDTEGCGDFEAAPMPPPAGGSSHFSNVGPLDFEVLAGAEEPCMDVLDGAGAAREAELYPDRKTGFYAKLNARAVMCWGETEHEAIRNLLNYVAQLCTAGCMDHTGMPVAGLNRRRYQAVFPGDTPDNIVVPNQDTEPQGEPQTKDLTGLG
jgi:hypothetical protein